MGADQLTPPPPPPGFELSAPPPPAGFDFAQPAAELPPPPAGFDSPDDPLRPDKTPTPEKTNTEVPGFWSTVGSAFGRGTTERIAADVAGMQVVLPKGLGGKTLEETYQEGLLHPETKDEIDSLLAKKVNQGWTDPKWWGAQVAHGTGSMVPGLATAAVGSLARVPAPLGFGVEGGVGTLVPAYKAARAAGLEPEEATTRALVDSGIAASTAVAMGLAPSVALYGKVANPAVVDQVAVMLKRPVMEMLTQLGIVQPSLAISGHLATTLSHGESPDPWDLATTGVVGLGMGVVPVGMHGATSAVRAARRTPSDPLASQATIDEAFRKQNPDVPPPPPGFTEEIAPGTVAPTGLDAPTGKPAVVRPTDSPAIPVSATPGVGRNPFTSIRQDLESLSSPEGANLEPSATQGVPPPPALTQLDETLYPRESRLFFSPARKAIEDKLPDNASVEQTLATLRNAPGVKQEELNDLRLPAYLAGIDGKVNKKDLLAYIESNAVVLEEVMHGEGPYRQRAKELAEAENGRGSWERIGGGGQEHYLADARREFMRPYVEKLHATQDLYGQDTGRWPHNVRMELQLLKEQVSTSLTDNSVEYPRHGTFPDMSNHREFILKTPPRAPDMAAIDARAAQEYASSMGPGFDYATSPDKTYWQSVAKKALTPEVYTDANHWTYQNPIVHFLTSDVADRNGRNLLHVREIQSTLHQEGAKVGYKDPNARTLDAVKRDIIAVNFKERELQERYSSLFDLPTDELARLQREGKFPQEILDVWDQKKKLTEERQKLVSQSWGSVGGEPMPDLPFKTSWQELAVKRILQIAADEGYDGVSWANGDQVGTRLNTFEQVKGAREVYDGKIPSLFKKWAKKMGMDSGTTVIDGIPSTLSETVRHTMQGYGGRDARTIRLEMAGLKEDLNPRNGYVEVNPAAGTRIRQGLPLYEEGPKAKITLSEAIKTGTPKELVEPAKKLIQALGAIGRDIKLSRGIEFDIRPVRATWRGKAEGQLNNRGEYVIRINTRILSRVEDLYATMAHELGHVIQRDKFAGASDAVKLQVAEAFRKFRTEMNTQARTVGDVRRVRDNAVSEMTGGRNTDLPGRGQMNDLPLSDLQPRSRTYLLHFNEWFAEQVAKWATTSEKPLSRVDKFFAEVGKTVRNLIQKFQQAFGKPATAEKVMQDWLDSLIPDSKPLADAMDKLEFDTKRRNADALARDGTPEVSATPATASTVGGRNILDALPPDLVGPAGPATAAHADRMNKFYEWMTSLPQIADLNKHIRPLQIYKEIVATMNIEKNNIMGDAFQTLEQWKQIRDPKQLFGLNKFIEDYMNGMFKDPGDLSGTIRRPTSREFTDLVTKHKLSDQSVRMFQKLVGDFDGFLEQYRQLLIADAIRIKDPTRQTQSIADINKRVDTLLQRPYFPAMRFGKYTVTVYDSAGNVRHFEQTETLRRQAQIKTELEKSSDLLPGDRVRTGEVSKDAAPLLGMPPGLLDLIADKLDLSDTQKGMLDQLRFDYAPSQSFRHQFKGKDVTPGYNTDFQRQYANFFFHGANHITRVKWVDALRDQVREVKTGSIDLNDANKRDAIANYMTEHLKMLVDPKPDFAALRGLMFHWYLGFNPASASLNLSQTPLMTFPHLASKFGGLGIGDVRAIAALTRASVELNNFYKKGTLLQKGKDAIPGPAGAKERALAEAVSEGVISETQAHTLAAVSEDRNMLKAFGSKSEEGWAKFSEASSWMFEMTEQYNRRVAFRAAWDLAMRDPNNKYVAETIRDNPLQYQRLRDKGWAHQEAAAFTAAKDSTERTQFVYAPYARPKFMWGRKGALFIFKSFVQNTLFNLYNNPAAAGRSLLILGALGGLMGLPGVEDLNGIIKALGWRLFGKDWDVEDHARKFAVDVLKGAIGPDMLLHGTSVKGFGIPHVMNATGAAVGLPKWFPTLDRHGSIGMGNILPVEPGKLFGPSKTPATAELAQLQRASGAGFSNIFAMYNFLTSSQSISDMKRWEGIMPRAASNVSHAFRYFSEGQERNRRGNSVVKFDVGDTEQMAEILARAAGYQPRRLTGAWEAIAAKTEAETYWQLRQQILLRQFGEAVKKTSPEDKATVLQAIRNYNQELTEPHLKPFAITSQTLKDSVTNRLRQGKKQELGMPTSNKSILLYREMDKYFPDGRPTGQVDARPVK